MKFSIITPSFNQLDWLRLCVASVGDQVAGVGDQEPGIRSQGSGERLEVEHLVQDACSTGIEGFALQLDGVEAQLELRGQARSQRDIGNDGSEGKVGNEGQAREFKERGHPVRIGSLAEGAGAGDQGALTPYCLRVLVEPDAGMYDAINRGLKRATGDICAWLNCDEQYLPGTLAKVRDFFTDHPEVEMVFGDVILVDETGAPLSYRRTILPDRTHLRLNQLNTPSCGTFFRRSIIERGLLFDSEWKAIGDAVWMDTLLSSGVKMALLQDVVAIFTLTGANLSTEKGALEEMKRWREQADAPPHWMRQPSSMLHRLKKLAAGAYRERNLRYSIYTRASPQQRVEFQADRLGYSWPAADVSAAARLSS